MEYEVDRAEGEPGEPSIAEMTEKAINILKKNPKGYFLLVEGECLAFTRTEVLIWWPQLGLRVTRIYSGFQPVGFRV